MVDAFGIEIIEIGDNFIKGTMPVDHRTLQPEGNTWVCQRYAC